MADLKKEITLSDLLKRASSEYDPVSALPQTKPVIPVKPTQTTAQPVAKPVAKTIVPQQAVVQPATPATQPTEPSFLQKMFTSDPVEPGEYSTGRKVGEGVIQFLGNFGNSISGNAALNPALNQAFAQQRQEYMDRDPNSRSSILYRGMAKTMGLPIRGDETAFTLKEQMPNVKEFLMARQMQMRGQGGPGAPKPLSGEQQKVVSNSSMALQAISDMRNALKKGTNTFSLIGDNDFTEARRRFAEGFGRLQSGGVIGAEELQNFEALAPKVTDSKEQQQAKLDRMEAELRSRIKLAGIEPSETGGDRSEASAKNQIRYVRDKTTGKTLKVNGLGEVLE